MAGTGDEDGLPGEGIPSERPGRDQQIGRAHVRAAAGPAGVITGAIASVPLRCLGAT
jgi:hypothetical protein